MHGNAHIAHIATLLILSLMDVSYTIPVKPSVKDNTNTLQTNPANIIKSMNFATVKRSVDNAKSLQHNLTALIEALHLKEPLVIEPAVLEYENESFVAILERISRLEDEDEIPSDTYEVSLDDWTEISGSETAALSAGNHRLLGYLTGAPAPPLPPRRHSLRHGVGRSADRRSGRIGAAASFGSDLLKYQPQTEEGAEEDTAASDYLNRSRFNITVEQGEPFRDIERSKLIEIILIMRSDCTLLPKTIVRWVTKKRGILFHCKNGVWVVTYLKRANKARVRPVSISDCNDIHESGVELSVEPTVHDLFVTYSDGERVKTRVLCKHDASHTAGHDTIDNRINSQLTIDTTTTAGGWTLIQRRISGELSFYRPMKRYKRGFGKVQQGEYWLGLDLLHEMTNLKRYKLRVEITTGDNNTYISEYTSFKVGSESKHYRLKLGAFEEPDLSNRTILSAGDILSLHDGGKFHAKDSQNYTINCGQLYGAAFWFRGCWATINLNGPYVTTDPTNHGVRWATANPNEIRRVWKTEMMIQPIP